MDQGCSVAKQEPIIRASEISLYVFCARAWWLERVRGYRSANVPAMRLGTARHRAHGRAVEAYHLVRRLAVTLIVLAAAALVAWLLLNLVR
jgi:CRISPR/Cas system-associated exonuclease Cas4 (RecB family)